MGSKICFLLLVTVLVNLLSFSLNGQTIEQCGQHTVTASWFKQRPDLQDKFFISNHHRKTQNVRQPLFSHTRSNADTSFTIPVVFHILHLGGTENISDEQIYDQVRILNRDYQKRNADTSVIVPAFKQNIANVGFEFKLAALDPEGNCTNGIVRHYTSKTNWDANKLEDFIYSWPTNKYLNFYIVKNINIAPAYTFLPGIGIPESADAIVCQSNLVGSIGTASVQNSRVLTHEVGHWFGLPHIWGISNSPGVECGDDFVNDTPITKGFINCSINNSKICDPNIEENVQNYMDYTPCKIMFTKGQSAYMIETISLGLNDRDNIGSESNLISTGIIGSIPCKVLADFYSISTSICKGETIKFYNQSQTGSNDGALEWKVQNAIPSFSNDSIVEITFPEAGEYEVKLIVSSVNGIDSVSKFIQVYDGSNGVKPNVKYSFDNETLPIDIQIINQQSDDVTWKVNQETGAENTKGCIYIDNFSKSDVSGNRDYFETPFFDLKDVSRPQFSFYYAYAKKFESQADSFKIEYTLDCGRTWKNLSSIPGMNTMANLTGGIRTDLFIPATNEWRKVTLTSAFRAIAKNQPSIKFRFYFKSDSNSDGSNNLYIDEINILDETLLSSLDQNATIELKIFPNPSSGEINLEINEHGEKELALRLTNSMGMDVSNISLKSIEGNKSIYCIAKDKVLLPGVYYLHIIHKESVTLTKKIVVID